MKTSIAAAALIALATLAAHPAPAQAQSPAQATAIGKFGEWEAAWFMDGSDKVCYMAARPQSTKADKPVKGRDDTFLFVTHWPGDDDKNAVTVTAGFTIKPGTKAVMSIDGRDFTMVTGGRDKQNTPADAQMAWMDDQAQEDELAVAISKGSTLTVKTYSLRGNGITDTYSLTGSGDAYKAITKECGY